MKVNKEDLVNYKALKAIINNTDFSIRGDAMLSVASLFNWYLSLEKRLILSLNEELANKSINEIKPEASNVN